METSRNILRGIPNGSQLLIGSFPNPPGTARGPYTGFAASNLALPQAVIGGVSLLMVRMRLLLVQVPLRSCASCAADGALCARARDAVAKIAIRAKIGFRIEVSPSIDRIG